MIFVKKKKKSNISICQYFSGLRFANYQAKIGIIAVVNKFKLEVCDETCKTYDIEPRSVIPAPKGGICLKISKAM